MSPRDSDESCRERTRSWPRTGERRRRRYSWVNSFEGVAHHTPLRGARRPGREHLLRGANEVPIRIPLLVERLADLANGHRELLPKRLAEVRDGDQPKDDRQVIGKLASAVDARLVLEFAQHRHQPPALVPLAVQMPPQVERGDRVEIEGAGVELFQAVGRDIANFIQERGDLLAESGGMATTIRIWILEEPRDHLCLLLSAFCLHSPLLGPCRNPNPADCFASIGSCIISMASSRYIGGMTKRSSNVQREVRR